MSGTETEAVEATGLPEARRRVLAAALAGAGPVRVVGEGGAAAGLAAWRPDLFVADADAAPPAGTTVLAVGDGEPVLRRAAELARESHAATVLVLAARVPDSALLRGAGLVLEGWERLLYEAPPGGPPHAVSRAERLDAETRDVLLRCLRADDPDAPGRLAEAVRRLQRELDVRAQLEVDHARTREAERARGDRLRELEAELGRLRGVDLVAEVERLRAEIDGMRATRVWRLGAGWWRLKARLRRSAA